MTVSVAIRKILSGVVHTPLSSNQYCPNKQKATGMSEQAVEAFSSVEQTLAAVEEHLAVFKQNSMEEFVAPLSPLERAKVQVSLGM